MVRTMLDSGSQRSAVLKNVASQLELRPIGDIELAHRLFGGSTVCKAHNIFEIKVCSLDGSGSVICQVLDEEKIVDGVPPLGNLIKKGERFGIQLTDHESETDIQLLLGNDVYGSLMTGISQRISQDLVAIKTRLGWVVSGDISTQNLSSFECLRVIELLNLTEVKKLWELDVLGIKDPIEVKSQRELDEEIKKHFLDSVSRNADGRYEIKLPWVRCKENLACNYQHALKRLEIATRRLHEKGIYEAYEAVFQEWLDSGIIEVIEMSEHSIPSGYYLPHRAVVKLASETTKVRPVFDASCKTATKFSLNDCLAKGPNLIEMIPDLLIKFRLRAVAAVSDIAKAFLQISVDLDDREFLKFLWWEKDKKTVRVLRHKRVVFGVISSPFLLAAVIENHLAQVKDNRQAVAKLLQMSFYVDNCIVSLNSEKELAEFRKTSVELLAEARMELRLWKSNVDKPDDDVNVSVLGLEWNRRQDSLKPKVDTVVVPEVLTKRVILAVAQSIFDPMGMFSPVTLQPKLLLRQLCIANVGWDEQVPEEIEQKFRRWCVELQCLHAVEIPRRIAEVNPEQGNFSLHVFGDASQDAYACAVYVRSTVGGVTTSRLMQSKARVAPKNATIPRLELLACLIAARLGSSMLRVLKDGGIETSITYWSDSKTALTWIRKENQYGTFVNNRIKEIRKLTSIADWRFVPGVMNPADLPSRGCSAASLVRDHWWDGPQWLCREPITWPTEADDGDHGHEPDIQMARAVKLAESYWYLPLGSFEKNVRVIARMLRWRRYKRHSGSIDLSVQELEAAENKIWWLVQQDLQLTTQAGKLTLTPNGQQLWCVKTRVQESHESLGFIEPVYIRGDHPALVQYVLHLHKRNAHAPEGVMIVILRNKFWIPGVRLVIRRILKRCVQCQRIQARHLDAPAAPLPHERLIAYRCFVTTGVDLAGPLTLRCGQKAWFVLFTCAVYRAIHLEVVTSLSTPAFMLALRRFIARRGRPHTIYSDNGTNFVGLENHLSEIDWSLIQEYTAIDRIRWKFNPPTASWWGGWWERLIGIVKNILKRILGKSVVNLEELITILCDVEYVVNNRPLTKRNVDNGDLLPLTPQMFLSLSNDRIVGQDAKGDGSIGEHGARDLQGAAVPDIDYVDRVMLNKQFEARQKLMEDLRKRFVTEYLANLVEHQKGVGKTDLKVGDLVLIGTDNESRVLWPLARVLELIPGKDGTCRLVPLKTRVGRKTGEALRPIQRVYPLETDAAVSEGDNLRKCLSFAEPEIEEVGTEVTEDPLVSIAPTNEKIEMKTRSGRLVKKPQRLIDTINGIAIVSDLDD